MITTLKNLLHVLPRAWSHNSVLEELLMPTSISFPFLILESNVMLSPPFTPQVVYGMH